MEVRLGVGDGERVSACLGWGNNVEMGWRCEWPEEVTSEGIDGRRGDQAGFLSVGHSILWRWR